MVQQGGSRYPVSSDETRGSVVKIGLRAAAAGLVLALAGGVASAGMVFSDEVGDRDGFGGGIKAGNPFDQLIDVWADPADVGGTDEMVDRVEVTHTLSFSGALTGAQLTLLHGGWGGKAPARVAFNGVDIGPLTVGEIGDENFAWRDTFDLFQLLSARPDLLTGTYQVTITTTPIDATQFDDGVLDYSQLTFMTDAGGGIAVPEPTSWALTSLALAGLAASRRRQAR